MKRQWRDTILMLAAPEDDAAFRAYASSIGLTLLHPHIYKMTAEENERALACPTQGGLFSFLPADQLHRHSNPNIGVCEALDPLIRYIRPCYVPPHLIAGQVIWYTDADEMARQTKPYFDKLRRWVRANWKLREEDGYNIGPHAERILHDERPQIAYMPPGVSTKTIIID